MPNLIQDFLDECNLSSRTIQTYHYYLGHYIDYLRLENLSPDSVTPANVRNWFDSMNWAGNTRRVTLCAIRAFSRFHYGASHPILKMKVGSIDAGPQRTLSEPDVEKLFGSLNPDRPTGLRNFAMIALMLDTGLRCAEICGLELRHLDLKERILSVIVKGGDWGDGVFTNNTADWLRSWIDARYDFAGPGVGTVFVSIGGNTPGEPLTRDGMRAIFRRLGERAGIGLISPHDLRRTFATMAIRNGANTRLVQKAGRWKNLREVERYTRQITAKDIAPYSPMTRLQIRKPPNRK